MMKYSKSIHIAISIAGFVLNQNLWAERHTQMTLFFKQYPEFIRKTVEKTEHLDTSWDAPEHQTEQIIRSLMRPNLVNGIFATYAGFLSTSNADGQIAFPIRHNAPMIYLYITTRVTPINMNTTTIAYWELEEKAPIAVYKMERKKDNKTGIFFWEVTQEKPPADRRIPLTSIIIFAKPESVFVPLGISITDDAPNLHLPDIYVKPEINKLSDALYVLYLKHFFGQLKPALKRENKDNIINLMQ